MTTAATFRALALALPEAEESPHFERTSFRVRGKIFATLDQAAKQGVVKLSVPDQTARVALAPDTFLLLGGWSKHGWTGVALPKIGKAALAEALETSWRNVAPKKLIAALDASKTQPM